MFYEVVPTKVFRSDSGILTYSSDLKLQPGHIVSIPLGRQTAFGIVLRRVPQPDFTTKPIAKLLYEQPLPPHLIKSLLWLSQYYLCPLPTVANLLLPKGLDKKRRIPQDQPTTNLRLPIIPLNAAQSRALRELDQITTPTKLLHGITGSGKTNLYLQLAAQTLAQNHSVILLVPEISLTSQLVQAVRQTFGDRVSLIHSQQTEAARHLTWQKILTASTPQIIVGPRSALFAPVTNLGLIIIDEAHEFAYCQDNPPKYSALRLASFMAQTLGITCLQGTATPLVQDYYLAQQNHALVELNTKAITTAHPPKLHVIDLKSRTNFTTNRYFSDALIKKINDNLARGHQTLIFHNRRGSAPLTLCTNCGWQALCPTCFLPLTLHTDRYQLLCHTCGYQTAVPKDCPTCHHPEIIHKGFGTKLLESELKKLFKDATVARFDADNQQKDSLHRNYQAVQSGDIDIIVGTQTIARGLDLPHLATVGIVQADAGLSLPDYAAEERTYHLLTQVIGRVGRGHLQDTSVFLQTFQPDHPVIQAAVQANYSAFAKHLLATRQKSHFPPFAYLAKLTVTYKTEATTIKHIKALSKQLASIKGLHLSTPTPAFHEQSPRGFTWQLILKSTSRQTLLTALKDLPPGAHFTIDPPSLL